MKIKQVHGSGQTPPVKVQIEDWCRLCDALNVPPDSSIERIIKKAQLLSQSDKVHRTK